VQIIGMSSTQQVNRSNLPDHVMLVKPQRSSEVGFWPLRVGLDIAREVLFHRGLAATAAATGADVYHCHDLHTVWAGLHASGGRAHVVYDSHELFTERVGIRPWRAKLFRWYERWALAQVDLVIAASEPRASIMHHEYGAPRLPVTIANAAKLSERVSEPALAAVTARRAIDAEHVILYQGGLMCGRGIEAVIDAMALLPASYSLVLMGPGSLHGAFAEQVRVGGLEDRVHIWPTVRPDEVVGWAAAADAGVITYLPTCRNNAYCAPNKLSEYAAAALPILGADLPGLRVYLDEFDMGELFIPGDPRSFAAAARRLLEDDQRTERARQAAQRLLVAVNWESQAERLVQSYRVMLGR
jgi:glycosyltransferase involved in cell wall biosynthesis